MSNKYTLIWVILLLNTWLVSGQISIDKDVYQVEETVTINLSGSPVLDISRDNISLYRGDYNDLMYFYPTEEGLYKVSLLDLDGKVTESKTFEVSQRSNVTAPIIPVAQLPTFTLEKPQYFLGEMVRLLNTGRGDFNAIKIYYAVNGTSRRYMGDPRFVEFAPVILGTQALLVYDASDVLYENHTFQVIQGSTAPPSAPKGPNIRIRSSSGNSQNLSLFDSIGQPVLNMPPFSKQDFEVRPSSGVASIKFFNASITTDLSLGVEDLPHDTPSVASLRRFGSIMKSYAIDPTTLNFSYGIVSATAVGNELWKCALWIYSTRTCAGNWTKLMDLVPGQNYSFNITPDDPGFTETSPTNGTADFGDVLNQANINYNNGGVNDTRSDNNVFWANGRSNGGGQQLDPAGYMNFTYDLSSILLNRSSQIMELNFSIRYCHSNDVTAPTICAALSAGAALGTSNAEVYNHNTATWEIIGPLSLRSGVEGENNYTIRTNLSDYISSTWMVSIRYQINFTITVNSVDAALAIEYAPLTVTHDKTNPSINFTSPTPSSPTILNRNYTLINVSANDSLLRNMTIYIYDLTGGLYRNVSFNVTSLLANLTVNFTNLAEGKYFFNATAFDNATNYNFTETRNLTINLTIPSLFYSTPTETSGSLLSRGYLMINTSYIDSTLNNISTFLYNSSGALVAMNFTTSGSSFFINYTDLADGIYYFNSTAYDQVDNFNFTATRNVTIDASAPNVFFEAMTEGNGQHQARTYIQINASATDFFFANLSISLFNSSGARINLSNTTANNLFVNFTGLAAGTYFFNATACDTGAKCNTTETRNVTIDLTNPTVSLTTGTDANNSYLERNYIHINATGSDQYLLNITINIFTSGGSLYNSSVSSTSPFFWNATGISSGTYFFNATACDRAGNCVTSETWTVTIDSFTLDAISSNLIDTLAAGTRRAMLAYGENPITLPRYRLWNGTDLGPELNASNVGAVPEWLRVAAATNKDEYAMITADSSDDINIQMYGYVNSTGQCWHNGSLICGSVFEPEQASTGVNYQKVEIAYETLSGDIVAVYIDSSTAPDVVRYVVWNGTTWSTEATVPQTLLSGNMEQVRIAESPNSDEIALVMTDANDDANIMIWNGTAWTCQPGAPPTFNLAAAAYQTVDIDYEQVSGDLLVTFTDNTLTEINFTTKPAGTCSYITATTTTMTLQADIVNSNSQPGTDYILIGIKDNGNDDSHPIAWNGTNMVAVAAADASNFADASPNRIIGVGWAGGSDTGMFMYSDAANVTGLSYMLYNKSSDSWLGGTGGLHTTGVGNLTNLSNGERNYESKSYLDENKLISIIQDDSSNLYAKTFSQSGLSWQDSDGGASLESASIGGALESLNFDFEWEESTQVSPYIYFLTPSDNSSTYVGRNYIQVNVTANDTNFFYLNLSIFNSSGTRVRHSTTNLTLLYVNATNLAEGIYYFNATACDRLGNCNYTETRNVTIDLTAPVTLLDQPSNFSIIVAPALGYAFTVNATVTDAGQVNTVSFFYRVNETSAWVSICTDTDLSPPYSCTWDLTGLVTGNRYQVMAYANDSAGNLGGNDTHINISIVSIGVNVTEVLVDDTVPVPTNEIDLTAGQIRLVYCNVTVVDPIDYTNITLVNASFFSSTVNWSSNDTPLNHYSSNCSLASSSGVTGFFSCVFNVTYYAVNGTWNCTATALNSYSYSNKSDNVTVNQLFALNISTSDIDYTNISPNAISPEVSVNITNMGNVPINISVFGFGGDNYTTGSNLSLICSINNVSIGNHKFDTASSTYAAKRNLTSSPVNLGLTLPSQINATEIRNSTYWQLTVSPNTFALGQCNGSVVFEATAP